MNEFIIDKTKILYRESYWDQRVLGFPTIDISSIEFYDEIDYPTSIKYFLKNLNKKYKFISFRMVLNDINLKKELINNGFNMIEQSYVVECLNPQFQAKLNSKINIDYLGDSKDEIEQVKRISRDEFQFGRFFEDPFIDIDIAKRRNEYWINDIIGNSMNKILVAKKDNIIIGFMAYKIEGIEVELLLGGLTSKYVHHSYGFWSNIFENYFKSKLIKTTISCSNLGVVNLYKKFGFNFKNHMSGFHLHI